MQRNIGTNKTHDNQFQKMNMTLIQKASKHRGNH
jgi:hypothetical protein